MTRRCAVFAACLFTPFVLAGAQLVAPPPPPPPPAPPAPPPPAALLAPEPPPAPPAPPAPARPRALIDDDIRAEVQARMNGVQDQLDAIPAAIAAHAVDMDRIRAEVDAQVAAATQWPGRDQQGVGPGQAPRITQFFQGDPADSLYRAAAAFYSRAEYRQAADRFAEVRAKFPATRYFCDASYNEAFSRYQLGLPADLRTGKRVLDGMGAKCADRSQDVPSLMLRINTVLARSGDADAAAAVRQAASQGNICDPDDRSVKIAALNALAQSNDGSINDQLGKVLAKTDHCSAPLRYQAIQIVARRDDAASVTMLMQALKNDPEPDNKLAAVRSLGSMSNDAAYTAMEELMRTSSDASVQRNAASAMAHSDNPRAQAAVRALIERSDVAEPIRISAIQALGTRSCSISSTASAGGRGAAGARPGRGGAGGAGGAGGFGAAGPTAPPASQGGRAQGQGQAAAAAAQAQGQFAAAQAQMDQAKATITAAGATVKGMVGNGFNFSGFGSVGSGCSSLTADEWRALYAKMNTDNLREAMINAVPRGQPDDMQAFLLGIAKNPAESPTLRVSALNRVRTTASIEDLMKVFETAESRSLRTSVVNGLGSRNEPEATDRLIEIAKTSTDVEVRNTAIRYLGQSNRKDDPKVKKALCDILALGC